MLKLYNGVEIPSLGLGAREIAFGQLGEAELARDYNFYIKAILSGQCSLYDTSAAYGRNDEALGRAILDTDSRSRVMIMSKVSNAQQREQSLRRAFEAHLKYMNTDYLDVYLIHWPQIGTFTKAYLELEKLYEEGLVKAIGVCNCNIHHLKELASVANIKPMINQFEITPVFTQDALVNYCKAFDIMPIAYSALGRMHDVLMKSEPIRVLAQRYKKTPAQIIVKWNQQLSRVALVSTRNEEHFKELFQQNEDYTLTDKEICWINSLNDNIRLRYDPDMIDFTVL